VKLKMDKDRKKILDRRAKGRAEALGKDKGKLNVFLDLHYPDQLVRGTDPEPDPSLVS
jgi:hypothetical protein